MEAAAYAARFRDDRAVSNCVRFWCFSRLAGLANSPSGLGASAAAAAAAAPTLAVVTVAADVGAVTAAAAGAGAAGSPRHGCGPMEEEAAWAKFAAAAASAAMDVSGADAAATAAAVAAAAAPPPPRAGGDHGAAVGAVLPFSPWRAVSLGDHAVVVLSLADGPTEVLARAAVQLPDAFWRGAFAAHLAQRGVAFDGDVHALLRGDGDGGGGMAGAEAPKDVHGSGDSGDDGGGSGGSGVRLLSGRRNRTALRRSVAEELFDLAAAGHYAEVGFIGAALWEKPPRTPNP